MANGVVSADYSWGVRNLQTCPLWVGYGPLLPDYERLHRRDNGHSVPARQLAVSANCGPSRIASNISRSRHSTEFTLLIAA
jgi:hypothetical protein